MSRARGVKKVALKKAHKRGTNVLEKERSIRKACALTDSLFSRLVRNFGRFHTEQDVSAYIKSEIRSKGLRQSFKSIVGSAEGGAEPHHAPKNTPLKEGFCVIDFGIRVEGYCADLTRTIFLGKPSAKDRVFYNLVLKAQRKPVPHLKHGARAAALYEISAKALGKYRKNFIHGLGHGLGKNIHIKPYIKATSLDILKEGDIVTVEPGIYFKGKSGIRIEDDFLITKHGARQLTHAPSGLIMLPLPNKKRD